MRGTVNLDEPLLAEAHCLTGLKERTALIRKGLMALIERESAHRLSRRGGSAPSPQPDADQSRRDSGRHLCLD